MVSQQPTDIYIQTVTFLGSMLNFFLPMAICFALFLKEKSKIYHIIVVLYQHSNEGERSSD
jgi:sorbitol-specific phosphotransferase system component IIC